MGNIQTIDMAKTLAPIIGSRDSVQSLAEEMREQTVQLDLSGVRYLSRSAAHELLTLKETLGHARPKQNLQLINAKPEVGRMLRTVAANRVMPQPPAKQQDIRTISIRDIGKGKGLLSKFGF